MADDPTIEQWEFLDTAPTREDVLRLLSTLPPVHGVQTVEFAEHVSALPASKKEEVRDERGRKTSHYRDSWRLYMGVAGRVAMLMEAERVNDWRVNFVPDPDTEGPAPGIWEDEKRIVYREYVVIEKMRQVQVIGDEVQVEWELVGRRPGMAAVPKSGGSGAAGSNPYEKVETAARGRALAAFGFGVLPGSGIASLEEMQSAADAPREPQEKPDAEPRKTRGELLGELLTVAEQVRQKRGIESEEMNEKLAEYVKQSFGIDTRVDGSYEWEKVKDGQIVLTINELRRSLAKLVDAEQPV